MTGDDDKGCKALAALFQQSRAAVTTRAHLNSMFL